MVLAVLAPPDLPDVGERVRDAAREVRDWPAVLRLAGRHEVGFPLYRGLSGAAADRVPPGILAVLEDHVRRQRELGSRATDELRCLLAALAAAGIRAMPLKGPLLARRVYGDVGSRISRDLDFLVREEDIPRTLALLEREGYREPTYDRLSPAQRAAMRRLYGELAYTREGSLTVEPHWALAQSTQAIGLDYAAIWDRSREVEVDGVRVTEPDAVDRFAILVVHGSKEVWRLAKWVADLAALVVSEPDLEWELLLERARHAGLLRMTHVAWRLLASVGVEPPDPVSRSLGRDAASRPLARYVEQRLARGETEPMPVDRLSAFRFRVRERFRDRWRYAWRTIGTPRPVHFGIARIPDPCIALYVPLKIVHDYLYLPAIRWVPRRAATRATG